MGFEPRISAVGGDKSTKCASDLRTGLGCGVQAVLILYFIIEIAASPFIEIRRGPVVNHFESAFSASN